MLPRNLVSQWLGFLIGGFSWSFINVRPKMLFPMSGWFICERNCMGDSVFPRKKFLPPDILGVCVFLRQSFTQCLAVLPLTDWTGVGGPLWKKMAGGWAFCRRGSCPPLRSFSPVYSSLFWFLCSSIPLVRKFFCFGNLLCPSCYPRAYCMEPMPWGGGPWLM